MRDNKKLDKISPSIAESICTKIFKKQILSDEEVNAALPVCKYYRDHKEERDYIDSVVDYVNVNNGDPYDSINIAYLIMEEDDVSWNVKLRMMQTTFNAKPEKAPISRYCMQLKAVATV
jgi:hypothetical protein